MVFTARADKRDDLLVLAEEIGLPLWRIGTISAAAGKGEVRVFDEERRVVRVGTMGFDHFGSNETA